MDAFSLKLLKDDLTANGSLPGLESWPSGPTGLEASPCTGGWPGVECNSKGEVIGM